MWRLKFSHFIITVTSLSYLFSKGEKFWENIFFLALHFALIFLLPMNENTNSLNTIIEYSLCTSFNLPFHELLHLDLEFVEKFEDDFLLDCKIQVIKTGWTNICNVKNFSSCVTIGLVFVKRRKPLAKNHKKWNVKQHKRDSFPFYFLLKFFLFCYSFTKIHFIY